MKTFSQYLIESPWGTKSAFDIIFYSRLVPYVPLSSKMLQRILKEKEELSKVTALHLADVNSFDSLVRLQHSKKAISCTTTLQKNHIFRGVETKGGIVVKVTGNVLLKSRKDAGTFVDGQGRRWISLDDLERGLGIDSDEFYEINKNLRNFTIKSERKFLQEILPKVIDYEKDSKNLEYLKYYMERGGFRENNGFIKKDFYKEKESIELVNKFKESIIRSYYVETEIQLRMLRKKILYNYASQYKLEISSNINEVVLNNIEIKSVLILKKEDTESFIKKPLSFPKVVVSGEEDSWNNEYPFPKSFDTENQNKILGFLKN